MPSSQVCRHTQLGAVNKKDRVYHHHHATTATSLRSLFCNYKDNMIAFVIPLRSKATARNWELISKLCLRTIYSLLQQTVSDYKIILVCNEPPDNLPSSEKIIVVNRYFPTPENTLRRQMWDKTCKVSHGLVEARLFKPSHYMVVDADDCVSRRLVEYASHNPACDGWFMDTGWIYHENSQWLQWQRKDFHRISGTGAIAPFDIERMPKTIDEDFNPYRPFVEHNRTVDTWTAAGKTLKSLQFPGAVYVLGTGGNVSDAGSSNKKTWKRILKQVLFSRPLTSQLRGEFGLTNIFNGQ